MKIPESMEVYVNNTPLVSKLFINRIRTAIDFASIKDNDKILDVGCDTGYLLKTIHDNFPNCQCFGIDKNPNTIKEINFCDVKAADARKLPFPNENFDCVFVLDILEHISNYENVIKELNRVLKIDGLAILSGPTESWFYKFCRFLWVHAFSKPEAHLHTIYDIEKKFEPNEFKLLKRKSLPGFPIPALFRISKFKKIKNIST